MKIHISRQTENLGIFNVDEVREGLGNGRFLSEDLVWTEGMEGWLSLKDFAKAGKLGAGVEILKREPQPSWEKKPGFASFFTSCFDILTKPLHVFSAMPVDSGAGMAFLFSLIGAVIGSVFSSFYSLVLELLPMAVAGIQSSELGVGGAIASAVLSSALGICFGTCGAAFGAFLGAGVTHLFIMILAGSRKSFWGTFKVVCYACGASMVFYVLPLCGACVAVLWCLVIEIIGLKETHGISTFKAAAAIFLPTILCCLCAAGIFGIVGGTEALNDINIPALIEQIKAKAGERI